MNKKGMTLIEIMIVLAILATVLVLGVPRLFKSNQNIKTLSHELSVIAKNVRDKARLSNSTYRIVVHIKPKEFAYWVERANGVQLLDPKAEAEKEKKDDKDAPPPAFQIDKSITKKPKNLANALSFVSLETSSTPQPVTEGDAYIYFFPQGFVEAAALQISMLTGNTSVTWTLVFNPLTGQADVVEKPQTLKDLQR